MSREIAGLIAEKFGLKVEIERLLERNIRSLDRFERRVYFRQIKPLEKSIKNFLKDYCEKEGDQVRERIINTSVESMLSRKGDPDLADSLVMDVMGRIQVYKRLRERSEKEGIKLSALTNFGGLSMVLFAVVIITAIVLYLKNV